VKQVLKRSICSMTLAQEIPSFKVPVPTYFLI